MDAFFVRFSSCLSHPMPMGRYPESKGGSHSMEMISMGLGALFVLGFLVGIGFVCGKK